jgi:hypothetical protein
VRRWPGEATLREEDLLSRDDQIRGYDEQTWFTFVHISPPFAYDNRRGCGYSVCAVISRKRTAAECWAGAGYRACRIERRAGSFVEVENETLGTACRGGRTCAENAKKLLADIVEEAIATRSCRSRRSSQVPRVAGHQSGGRGRVRTFFGVRPRVGDSMLDLPRGPAGSPAAVQSACVGPGALGAVYCRRRCRRSLARSCGMKMRFNTLLRPLWLALGAYQFSYVVTESPGD